MQLIFQSWRRIALLAAVGAAVALLAACGGSDKSGSGSSTTSGSATSKDPIVIGRLSAQTGRLQVFDGPITQGLALAVSDINAQGGIDGRKLVLKTLDYGSDPARAAAAAQDLLGGHVDLMVPPDDQAPGLPVIQAATAKNVPSLNAISGPQATFKAAGRLYWNDYQNVPSEAAAAATFSVGRGYRRIFLLEDQIADYTKGFCAAYEASLRAQGGSIVGKDTFTSTETQIPAQIARMKSAGPDAVVLCTVPPGGVAAIKQVRDALPNVDLIGDAGFEGVFWHRAVPNLSRWYNVGAVSLTERDPALQAMLRSFGAKYGSPPSAQLPALGYAIGQLYKAAVERAGTTDTDKVAAALNGFKDQATVVGPTTYTPTCHVPVDRPMVIEGITNGRTSVVESVTPKGVPADAC
ncbi:MAG TPA: ABC transporter substrate-binding protein [Conexibacter sp.]|jgi:branched-chain amino acid transport system substrate-binding protein|nr:ABC transporter substrate-binding protein [Conexibacter sp.]